MAAIVDRANIDQVTLVDFDGNPVSTGGGLGGDASAANQTTGNASLASIDAKVSTAAKQDDIITAINNITVDPPVGGATEAKQDALIATIDNGIAVTGPFLTDTELRASPLTVNGPLTDTQLRATAVPVSGPLTDTQLRATAVPVSAVQSGSWTVTGPLTDTQLRASSVPVSGPLTDTQLRASNVPVNAVQSGVWNVTDISGTISLPTGAATSANQTTANTSLDNIDTTLADVLVEISGVRDDLAVEPVDVPHERLDNTSDLLVARVSLASTSEATLVAGLVGQNIRVHEITMLSLAAEGYVEFIDGNSGSVIRRYDFPVAGAWDKPFRARPYIVTSDDNNLRIKPSVADACICTVEYVQSA